MLTTDDYAGTGIAGLDQVLAGGFPRGHVYLIQGASGAGKTTLCLQFLIEGARNGEKALYLGTSETEQEIRAIAESHGWALDGVALHHCESPRAEDEQTMLHPAEVELPQTMESIFSVVRKNEPTRLVFDSLAEIRVLARNELWYRRQLMAIKRHFAGGHCTVLLTETPCANQPKLNSIVNGVFEMEQAPPPYGSDRRRLRVKKMRGHDFASGYHDYKIRAGGVDLFPRLTAADSRRRFSNERVGTGLTELDAMLHGGLVRGTSTLLLGPSGTAKSLLATQIAVAAAQRGERSAMYVFDERVQTLFQRAEGVGLPLERHVEDGAIQVRQVDPTELTPGEFSHAVKHLAESEKLRLLFIDSLNGYAYAMPDERLLSVHLHELASYLSQQAVTSVFTMTQHGLVSERAEQPFDVSYIVDTVILLRHFEFAGRVHKAVSVYKNRSSPHETSFRELHIGSGGVQVGEPIGQFQGILTGSRRFLGDKLNGHD